jgi:hypothetical protein
MFGVMALLHDYYMLFFPTWEFFQFLWLAALLVFIGQRCGLAARHFLVLALTIAAVNAIVPLGATRFAAAPGDPRYADMIAFAQSLWILPGPFYPLPWVAVVFVGFALGTNTPRRRLRLGYAATAGLILSIGVGVLAQANPTWTYAAPLELNKWAATTTYVVAGTCATLLLYIACPGQPIPGSGLARIIGGAAYPLVRFVSEHLIEATILHYLVVRLLTADWLGWNVSLLGERTMHWSTALAVSLLNLALLLALLDIVVLASERMLTRNRALLARLAWRSVAIATLLIWAALQCLFLAGAVRPGYLKWTAYALMLGLALYYKAQARRTSPAGD